jgi:hypothetical protein
MERTTKNKTYSAWIGMRNRCSNPNHPQYRHYGERGIKVCQRWNDYAAFLADMGEKPAGMSLDRIDNDSGYEPSNCCWATQKEQMRNMRITRRVTVEGVTYVAKDLAERLGVKTDTIVERAAVCKTMAELMNPARRVYTPGLAAGGLANGRRQREKTHCPQGHEYSAENTHTSPQGWRRCRTCQREKMRWRNAEKRKG